MPLGFDWVLFIIMLILLNVARYIYKIALKKIYLIIIWIFSDYIIMPHSGFDYINRILIILSFVLQNYKAVFLTKSAMRWVSGRA